MPFNMPRPPRRDIAATKALAEEAAARALEARQVATLAAEKSVEAAKTADAVKTIAQAAQPRDTRHPLILRALAFDEADRLAKMVKDKRFTPTEQATLKGLIGG